MKGNVSGSCELPQSTRVVLVLAESLSPSRSELREWKPRNGAVVGGVCRVERDANDIALVALNSGEERSLVNLDLVHDVFEWGREELLSSFEAKNDFVIFDPLGPELVLGEGLDSAVRAMLWKEEEDERDDDVEKSVIVLVVTEEGMIDCCKDLYKLDANRTLIFRGDFSALKSGLEAWYSKHHTRFLRRRKSIPVPGSENHGNDEISGHFYAAVRFPLLCGVLLLIGLELLLYTALLQIINFYETATRRHSKARRAVEVATHEKTWQRCARKLDILDGKPSGSLPDLSLAKNFSIRLERALQQLETTDRVRAKEELVRCLFEITAPDAVHMLLPESLYCHNHLGRNAEARKFVLLVERAIEFVGQSAVVDISRNAFNIRSGSPRALSLVGKPATLHTNGFNSAEEEFDFKNDEDKLKILSELARFYGNTALCLSGGACNAFFHLGVVRTLLERNVLPKHLSGASGGALVGAFIATHTDDELRVMLNNPALLARIFDPCSGAGWAVLAKNLLTRPSIFDEADWAEKMKSKVCGTLTFQEAFERTGRSLTIMVFNGDRHTRALNHKTAPDICIFSAVLASSAIPKLLPAIQLLRKTKNGDVVPFDAWGKFWRDGSFEEELPFEALARVFNASFTVVSQVNPHIAPFFFDNRASAGKPVEHLGGRGWRGGFVSSFLERVLKQDMKKWLQIMDEFRLLPPIFETDFSRLFLGRNFGSVTMVPPTRFRDYLNLVSDPATAKRMNHYVITGARMTFPKLAMIEDRLRIEQALEKQLSLLTERMRGRAHRSRSLSQTRSSRSSLGT